MEDCTLIEFKIMAQFYLCADEITIGGKQCSGETFHQYISSVKNILDEVDDLIDEDESNKLRRMSEMFLHFTFHTEHVDF